MNRYKVTKQLGDGTYGSVLKATNRQTGEVVSPTLIIDMRQYVIVYPLVSDGHQKDEEEILQLGGVHATARNQGIEPFAFLSIIVVSVFYSYDTKYVELEEVESSKHRQAEGGKCQRFRLLYYNSNDDINEQR